MRRPPVRPRTQLVLNLERRTAAPPIAPGSTALLGALADLLLEALGGEKAEVSGQEDADDAEDHT